MGREIRMVSPNWEHPRYTKDDAPRPELVGEYRSCYDRDYVTAADEFLENCILWSRGEHPAQKNGHMSSCKYYWEYDSVPDEETCRPAFTEPATWLQVYQTVSEGSPVTPPFATKEELVEYLVQHGDFWSQKRGEGGYSRKTAEAFVNSGWVPSMIINNGVIAEGIESAALQIKQES